MIDAQSFPADFDEESFFDTPPPMAEGGAGGDADGPGALQGRARACACFLALAAIR